MIEFILTFIYLACALIIGVILEIMAKRSGLGFKEQLKYGVAIILLIVFCSL